MRLAVAAADCRDYPGGQALQSFARLALLPPGNIQGVMRRVDRFEVSIGDQILEQGTAGDWFYMISCGRAVVTRDVGDGRPPVELAQLGPGDSFGEEALLSGRPRNCGVVMLSAGLLLRLSRQDFNDLIREPVARFQPYGKAERRVADGAKWLDVRSPDEHAAGHLPDALNLPVELLREHCGTLHPDFHYVVYSDTTGRSCAAAFLLTDRGYDVSVLQDGMASVPPDAVVVDQPATPTPAKAPTSGFVLKTDARKKGLKKCVRPVKERVLTFLILK